MEAPATTLQLSEKARQNEQTAQFIQMMQVVICRKGPRRGIKISLHAKPVVHVYKWFHPAIEYPERACPD